MRILPAFLRSSVLFAAVALIAAAAPASAAEGQQTTLTVSPSSSSPSVPPGGTYSGAVTILNSGSKGYGVNIYAQPYRVVGVGYDPQFTQLPGTTDASKWIHPHANSVSVPAQETVTVPYDLTAPAGTTPGGYYAVIFVETMPTPGAGVQTRSRVGDILYITVQGKVQQGGSLIATSLPHITMASKLPLSLEVSNTGGVHFLTKANLSVSNIFGRTVDQASYQRYVLPQTIRKIETTWTTPALGLYHVHRSATVEGKPEAAPNSWLIVIHPWAAILIAALIVLVIATIWRPRLPRRKAKR